MTIATGLVTYLSATFGGFAYPYLLSLGFSLLMYVVVAVLERLAVTVRDV